MVKAIFGEEMDLLDYLKWRNDVSLNTASLNDIDNVILSYISYIDFGELFGEQEKVYSIEDAFKLFCKRYSLDEIRKNAKFSEKAPLLLEEMVSGERFRGTKIAYYTDIFDKEKIKQFAAVVLILPDGTNYISFRGTDNTITGWKEDVFMSFTSEIEGAKEAACYLNKVSKHLDGKLILGGHSKGGNFAMYAASFCKDHIKDRITKVYNNDGPGFRDEVIHADGYKQISSKICNIVPQTSIIGQLLTNLGEQKVVRSNATGIIQHDAMTWEVTKDHFVEAELDALSKFVRTSLGSWLEKMDDETRESIIMTVFSMIEETEAETFKEFGGSIFKNTKIVLKEYTKLPKSKRIEIMNAFSNLIQAGGETIFDNRPRFPRKES